MRRLLIAAQDSTAAMLLAALAVVTLGATAASAQCKEKTLLVFEGYYESCTLATEAFGKCYYDCVQHSTTPDLTPAGGSPPTVLR